MFFDDRLATVLRQQGTSAIATHTQYRQLLDILGSRRIAHENSAKNSVLGAAWMQMDTLARAIGAEDRASMIAETSWRLRNPELVAHLADYEPGVAMAALTKAQLSAADWTMLIPQLPVRARGFLRLRDDLPDEAVDLLSQLGVYDRALPQPALRDDAAVEDTSEASAPSPLQQLPPGPGTDDGTKIADNRLRKNTIEAERSEISAIVERIAQFKRKREPEADITESAPRLPLGEEEADPRLHRISFSFSTDKAGRIDWADPELAPMLIGTRIIDPPFIGCLDEGDALQSAFLQRQPIIAAPTELEGAPMIAGEWIIDAQPSFTQEGAFKGYLGRFRRPADPDDAAQNAADREGDRIRQLLHELRTPVTAVQGYAEVIQQQVFGSAPHEYRALAANIAADAATILAGFDELERLARLETGALDMAMGVSNLASLIRATLDQITPVLSARGAGIECSDDFAEGALVALESEEAEGLVWRLLASLASACDLGETLPAILRIEGNYAVFTCQLPRQLASSADPFAANVKAQNPSISAGLFGSGFALRLVRAEAQSAGGNLVGRGGQIVLSLPILEDDDDLRLAAQPAPPASSASYPLAGNDDD